MSYSSEISPDSLTPPAIFAHPEDSTAPAEHLLATDLEDRLAALGKCKTPAQLLTRAWIYTEYPLATPGTETDDYYFDLARQDLEQIVQHPKTKLSQRDPVRLGAQQLLYYQPPFRERAETQPPAEKTRKGLHGKMGQLMLDFLEWRPDLADDEYGRLAELVTTTALLDSDLFPYLASQREEGNILPADNHDIYTLHACATRRIKKAPASIKYRQTPGGGGLVVVLTTGVIATDVARRTEPYCRDRAITATSYTTKYPKRATDRAIRLAADILVCDALGETLSEEDQAFKTKLITRLQNPLIDFASRSTTPDYASNAEILHHEILARQKQRARISKI